MTKTLENTQEQISEEFPNLEFVVLEVRKMLKKEKITPENKDYAKFLNTFIRLVLLKPKFGILKPGQPSEEKEDWFKRIQEGLAQGKSAKEWEIKSAQRHQWREEVRAGQSYQESGLE
jgi:hypothetical protein